MAAGADFVPPRHRQSKGVDETARIDLETIGQQADGGLPLSLNEVGIQTDSAGHAGYVGTETSANA